MKLLHLDSSILGSNSVSRALSADIVARERALHPGLEVIHREAQRYRAAAAYCLVIHVRSEDQHALGPGRPDQCRVVEHFGGPQQAV